MKRFFFLLCLLVCSAAFAQQGPTSVGGTLQNRDLFKVFFSWDATSLTIANNRRLVVQYDGTDAVPAILVGASPGLGGTSISAEAISFSSGSSFGRASIVWTPNSFILSNVVLGTNVQVFDTILANCDFKTSAGRFISRNATGGFSFGSAGSQYFGMAGGASVVTLNNNASLGFEGVPAWYASTPVIASGFGTSPSIVASNGTAAFRINVGTGGVASSGVITLALATTGWVCECSDLTTPGINVTKQTGTSTAGCTVANFLSSTGVQTAWSASDNLLCTATGF